MTIYELLKQEDTDVDVILCAMIGDCERCVYYREHSPFLCSTLGCCERCPYYYTGAPDEQEPFCQGSWGEFLDGEWDESESLIGNAHIEED